MLAMARFVWAIRLVDGGIDCESDRNLIIDTPQL